MPAEDVDDAFDVNTCGFIGEAKKESIATIFEMAELKKVGACKLAYLRRSPHARAREPRRARRALKSA